MWERLDDPLLYLAEIERVATRYARTAPAQALSESGPQLSSVRREPQRLARMLAREVSAGRYVFSSVVERRALIEGKLRALYVATPIDEIVLGVLAAVLVRALDSCLSPHVRSYRRGHSSALSVRELATFVARHRRSVPEPRARGLYVVRRDVRGYGDSIPSGEGSALFEILSRSLQQADVPCSPQELAWLRSALRPSVLAADGGLEQPALGVPTGSPLQPLMCNLYLGSVDALAAPHAGAFYARYGDDICFAHADAEVARSVLHDVDLELRRLGLEKSTSKCLDLYWNGAGRPSSIAAEFRGTTQLTYLGARIDFRGRIGLKPEHARRLLQGLGRRIQHADAVLDQVSPAERASLLCAVVNAALDPAHAACDARAELLRSGVNDRMQLGDIDHKISLLLAQRLAGRRGARAFRQVPKRALRTEHGLRSCVVGRNRPARKKSELA